MLARHLVATVAATLLLGIPGSTQSVADLFRKGVQAQETAGDLDGAIRLYRQALAAAADIRGLAAQAQYRLALCLFAKGDREAAAHEVEILARDFPDQPEIVAQARAILPGTPAMLPVPWGDREFSQFRMLNNGTPNGGVIVLKAETRPNTVAFETRMGNSREDHVVRAEADRETMRPISTSVRSIGMEFGIEYGATTARVRSGAGDPAAVPLAGPVFDEESLMFLLRRLPLAPGYQVSLPVMTLQGMLGKDELSVDGLEDVEVPAGRFRCYRLTFGVPKQTYWVGAGGARPLVRFQSGTAGFELLAVSNAELAFPFMNPTVGVLIQPSAGWTFPRPASFLATDTVDLVDPESRATAYVWMSRMSVPPGQITQVLRDSIPEKVSQRQIAGREDYRLRMGSTVSRLIGGHEALSCVAEYTEDGKPMAEYFTWILSEKAKVLFSATTEAADLPAVQQRLDAIIESTRIP